VITLSNGVRLGSVSKASGQVTFGVRPEHLVPDAKGAIKLEVEMLEQLGANTLVHGILQGTNSAFVASIDGIQTAETGSVLSFSTRKEALHLFDVETGKRLDE